MKSINIIVVALCFFAITACEKEREPKGSGKLGALEWRLLNKILTISGTAGMEELGEGDAPWYPYRDAIKKVVIEEGVTSVGSYAFYGCENLVVANLPQSINTIGGYAFGGCRSLEGIAFSNSLKEIGYAAFEGTGLTSVTIPASVEQIGGRAFSKCPIYSIVFNGPVENMGNDIFESMNNWTRVYLLEINSPPFPVHSNLFDDFDKDESLLIVPKGTGTLFGAAPVWQNFKNITER